MLLKKLISFLTVFIILILAVSFPLVVWRLSNNSVAMLEPLSKDIKRVFKPKYDTAFEENKPVHILLLGIDRRSRSEAYRTDIMIMLSINPKTKRVVLTSVPRDLWISGNKINAIYLNQGWEALQKAFEDITGIKPQKYILTDFVDFSWIIDAMGGVPVEVDTAFTDMEYPEDATKGYLTVSFNKGDEILNGDRALKFSRSRHGNNGEGSDWMRMKRQHKILKGFLIAVSQPKSLFNPMNVENAFKTVTQGRMDTNLSIDDAKFLWDFYKLKDLYTVESLFLDSEYLYSPPISDYGAWVLVPKDSFETFHQILHDKLTIESSQSKN